ncbi:MAG: DUF1801 domain-containing protein [Ignavibacterium sp.]
MYKSVDFAKLILNHLRVLVHNNCPDVKETIKRGFPYFVYKGEILCGIEEFKHHCVFGFWKADLMKDKTLRTNTKSESAMGHYGKIKVLNDLPLTKI